MLAGQPGESAGREDNFKNQLGRGVRIGVVGGAGAALVAGAAVGGGVDAAAAGGGGNGWPTGTIVTFFSTTGVIGLSRPSRSTRVIVFTTSTDEGSHCPKIV